MKLIKWLFVSILVVAVGIVSLVFIYLQSSRPVYHGEVRVRGLQQQVKVFHDHHGIPHIYASGDKDAYFALGYLHAQERLFQMELLRRVGAGKLSEIFGEEFVTVDAFFRTLGLHRSAKESATMFFAKPNNDWQKQSLAYLKGINTYMFEGPTPPEFKLLGIPKTLWTPEDLYLVTGYMAFSFAEALRVEPILDKIVNRLGPEYYDALTPLRVSAPSHDSLMHDSTSVEIAYLTDLVMKKMPIQPWIGSNGWAVAPSRSSSGRAILSNDTHIGYQQPAVWIESHLEYPGYAIYGNYIAGMPFPLVGHNAFMGWGLTMFENDDMNLYRGKTDNSKPGQYYYKESTEKFRYRDEIIAVKGRSDTTITVRETVYGPVINDVISQLDSSSADPVSLWWTYLKFPSTALQVTCNLANARSMSDARAAASTINAPGLNVIYADREGNIALWPSAKLPIYPEGLNTKIILNGVTGKDDITGYYEFEDHPLVENPESGFVYTANQQPGPVDSMPYPGHYAPDDRANRIQKLITAQPKWNRAQLAQLTLDDISDVHPLNAALIAEVISASDVINRSKEHTRAYESLLSWKGTHALKDTAPTIYYKLLSNIFEMSMKDELGEKDYQMIVNTHYMKNAYAHFLSSDTSPWWDDINTGNIKETRKEIFTEAFDRTVDDLRTSSGDMTNWSWGSIHTLEHVHPVGKQKPFDKIFNVGPFPVEGGIETINNAPFPLRSEGSFKVSYGPAMRKLVDFNDDGDGISVLPTGQSGHLRSPFYNDQASLHATGKFRPVMMNAKSIREKCTSVLTLIPR